ncbi:MAG TPA: RNA polymerase sporulation sigma factor SigG [Candidatus Pygmaiobacter gallistercoris]|nr:RNA polymerase sporulation sigma factor SigG [Candidatus Pygmaiobacter gallistercoris]
MHYNKVEICGVNTAKLPVLKEQEKLELIKKAQQGDEAARQKMIAGNLRLVLSVVQKFTGRKESMDDLFQVGCIGLIKAVDGFNTELGVRFSTYGVPMIVGEIRRFLRDNNTVRVSRSVRDLAYKAMQVREELQKKLCREPTMEEIAKEMQQPVAAITVALESVVDPISLYEPVYNDGGDPIFVMDQIGDSGGEDSWISSIVFRETMQQLTEREKKIMALRFLQGKTQVEVAGEIGISQAQVSRLEKNALERIKKQI